jgi:hypothetical protein
MGKIVVSRNGTTTVITGWRAWLIGTAALVGAVCIGLLAVSLALGMAITIGAVLLIALPILAGVALIASALGPRRR